MSASDTALWLCELIAEETAKGDSGSDYTVGLDGGTFGLISLEDQKVYLVTVQEARFEVCGDGEVEET